MVCANCAYNNSPSNRFCVRCGVDLTAAPSTPSADATNPSPTAPPAAPAPPNPWGAPPPTGPWAAPGPIPPAPIAPTTGYAAPTPAGPAPNPFAPPSPYGAAGAYPPPPGYGQYPPPYPQSGYQAPSTNGLAVASLVLGIVGWLLCGIGSIVGVVLGFVARSQIRASNGRQGGDGLALAGIILSFIGIGLFVLLMIISSASN
jgi:hypothetical protein